MYWGTAVEFRERQKFPRHAKAWGAEHTGPGIRFICDSDAVDDPDNKGIWTTLTLWNRWRHETFKDDRDAETQYLDELPDAKAAAADKGGGSRQHVQLSTRHRLRIPPDIALPTAYVRR